MYNFPVELYNFNTIKNRPSSLPVLPHNKGTCMHHRHYFLAELLSCCALIALLNCGNPKPITSDELPEGATRNGYYVVMTPYAGTTIKNDTTVAITWTWSSLVTDSTVRISLFLEDSLVRVISSLTLNDGAQSYSLTSIEPGEHYRIKIASVTDTSKYDFGGYFTVKNKYFGTITLTSPTETTKARVGDSVQVSWTTTDSIGPTIYLQLYRDTIPYTSYSVQTSKLLYKFPLSSSLIAGPKYRFKAWSYYNTKIFDYSDYFTLTSRYFGTIKVTAPTDTVKALIGSSVVVRWTTTDSVGSTVSIRLYNDTTPVGSSYSATTSNGSYTYTLPSSLVPGSKYRIKVWSYYDENINGFSSYFSITSQYNGGYTINSPDSGTTWAAGSSYSIQWTTTGTPGSSVRIALFKDGDSLSLISSSYSNSGSYQWTIPSGTITSKNYRIRVSSYYDPTIYALSDVFTISGMQADDYENDNNRAHASTITIGTTQNHTLTTNDTDFVAMNLDSGKTYSFSTSGTAYTYNYLFSSTDSVSYITYYSSYSGTGSLRWSCSKSGKYYNRITPYSSSYTGSYLFSVSEFDTLTMAKFITPDSTTTWASGSMYSITWTPDTALFGTTVYLYLWDELHRTLISSTSSTNGGSCSFSIPSGLATGKYYRIKMVSYVSSTIYGYSPKFTISGIAPDGFEPDNNRAGASTLVLGSVQNHTLSYRDTDFVAMNLDSGKIYLISNTGTAYTYNYIYSSTDSISYLTYFYRSSSSSTGSLRWVCPRAGKYYVRITQYSTSYTGDYAFMVTQFDSLTAARFIAPDSNTNWASGSSYSITWTPDTALFGTYVSLYLWDEALGKLYSIYTSLSNSGSYSSYTVPAGLATGKFYRIKLINYSSSSIAGYSKKFTITGIAPDGFEPDNKRANASTLVLGSPQSHTLSLGDTDFVAINCDSGKIYTFSTSGTAYTYNYLYSSLDSLSSITYYYATSSSGGQLRWTCAKTGKYYNRITQYSTSYLGAYSFNVTVFDSIASGKFITPDSTTIWAAGSTYSVTWTPDVAFFGSTIYLYLWDEKRRSLLTYTTASTSSGACSFTLPTGLESGKFYRMKMINYSTSANFAYSQLFNISGISPDAYEPDDSASMAKTISADSTVQARSLSRNDVDWATFSAIPSRLYVIGVACSSTTTLRFYASATSLTTPTLSTSGYLGSDAKINWFSSSTGTAAITVLGTAGNYRLWVKAYDSSAYRFTVTSPAEGDTFKIGSAHSIAWNAKVSLGGTVDLFLYNSANTPQTIIAGLSNSGSYSWSIPSSVAAGTGYYIKVSLHDASDVYGKSEPFTIVP
jgi:hypothetical protein